MTRLLADRAERYAPDLVPCCPDCHDYCHPTATVCDGCGQKLFPGNDNRPSRHDLGRDARRKGQMEEA